MSEFSAKRPGEVLLFSTNFAKRMRVAGETVVTSSCKVVLSDDQSEADIPAMKSGSTSITGTEVLQKIAAGTDGVRYSLIFEAVTSAGQTLQEKIPLLVSLNQT